MIQGKQNSFEVPDSNTIFMLGNPNKIASTLSQHDVLLIKSCKVPTNTFQQETIVDHSW